mmetsp:Transcript_4426/g.15654  ORF Transcript_4426/g.15654 Transcript_4426/m.15654 type:complete len:209 (-) Transcript_4426:212-838(-)
MAMRREDPFRAATVRRRARGHAPAVPSLLCPRRLKGHPQARHDSATGGPRGPRRRRRRRRAAARRGGRRRQGPHCQAEPRPPPQKTFKAAAVVGRLRVFGLRLRRQAAAPPQAQVAPVARQVPRPVAPVAPKVPRPPARRPATRRPVAGRPVAGRPPARRAVVRREAPTLPEPRRAPTMSSRLERTPPALSSMLRLRRPALAGTARGA